MKSKYARKVKTRVETNSSLKVGARANKRHRGPTKLERRLQGRIDDWMRCESDHNKDGRICFHKPGSLQ